MHLATCRRQSLPIDSAEEPIIEKELSSRVGLSDVNVVCRAFRPGDVRHSLADIEKAKAVLGYRPTHRIGEGLSEMMPWYTKRLL